ncbi:hypothetical protein CALCODRAFT_221080 [Calocera cornea HHB12733]|uniref:Uncharacterized protein n=1 Tax=Calocera cornea HHB12733 TaxID=1353952 RepID=A0A165C1P1_9BASI|nr:hypothetical protein CALCODRAFT_221080 [Calocera cornea HHB12733]
MPRNTQKRTKSGSAPTVEGDEAAPDLDALIATIGMKPKWRGKLYGRKTRLSHYYTKRDEYKKAYMRMPVDLQWRFDPFHAVRTIPPTKVSFRCSCHDSAASASRRSRSKTASWCGRRTGPANRISSTRMRAERARLVERDATCARIRACPARSSLCLRITRASRLRRS